MSLVLLSSDGGHHHRETAFRGLEKGDHVEPRATNVPADSDLVERAVEVAVQRLGFSRDEARDRLATNAAALALEPDELALLVLSGQRRRSRLAAAHDPETVPDVT
jgi:hypothetical protein